MTGMKKSKRLSVLLCLIMMISVLFAGQSAYASVGGALTINKEVAGNAAEKESKYKFDENGSFIDPVQCPPDHATAGWPNRIAHDLPADVLPAGVTKAGDKAGTYTFELSDSGSMVFSNIPADYKYYEISEDDNSSICNTYVDGTRGRAASGNLTADKTHTFSNRMLRSVRYDGNGADDPNVMSDKGYSGEYRSDLKAETNLYTREKK